MSRRSANAEQERTNLPAEEGYGGAISPVGKQDGDAAAVRHELLGREFECPADRCHGLGSSSKPVIVRVTAIGGIDPNRGSGWHVPSILTIVNPAGGAGIEDRQRLSRPQDELRQPAERYQLS